MDVILERVNEYSAVPEIDGCRYCEFKTDSIVQCQRAIGKPARNKGQAFDMVYCQETANPHGIGIIWVKTEDLPQYIALTVIKRIEHSNQTEY